MYRTSELCASFTLLYGDPDMKQEQEYLNALYGLTPRPMPRVRALTPRVTRTEQNESDFHERQEVMEEKEEEEQHKKYLSSSSDKPHKEEATWVSLLTTQRPQPVHGGAFITSHETDYISNIGITNNSNNNSNSTSTCRSCESDTWCAHLDEHKISGSYFFTESGPPSLAVFVPCDEHNAPEKNELAVEQTSSQEEEEEKYSEQQRCKNEVCVHHTDNNGRVEEECERLAKLTSLQRPWAVPCARSGHLLLSCSDFNCLVLHGGLGDTVMNDTWMFDCATRRWMELSCKPISCNGTNPHAHFPECAYGQAGGIYHRNNHTHVLVIGGIATRVSNGQMKDTCAKYAYSLDLHTRHWEKLELTVNLPALWGATGQTLHAPRRVSWSNCEELEEEYEEEEEEVFVMFGGVTPFDNTINDVYLFHLDHVLTNCEVYQNADLYLESVQYNTELNQRIRREMRRERNNSNNNKSEDANTTNTSSQTDGTSSAEGRNEFEQEWLESEEEYEHEENYESYESEYSWEAYNSDNNNNDDNNSNSGGYESKRMTRHQLVWAPSNHEIEQWTCAHANTLQRWRNERIESFVGKYWVEKLPLPDGLRGRRRASSAAFNEHFIFIFGGSVTFDFFNDLWVFNLSTRTWVELNVRTPLVWLRRFYSEPHNVMPGQMLTAFRLEHEGKEIKSEILNKWESEFNIDNGINMESDNSVYSSTTNSNSTNTVNNGSNTSNSVANSVANNESIVINDNGDDNENNSSTLLLSAPLSLAEPLTSSFYTMTNFTTAMPRTGSCMVADPTRQCLYVYGGFTVFHAQYVSFSDLHAYYITENRWKWVQINSQRLWKPYLDAGKGKVMKPNAFADAYTTGNKRAWRPEVKQLNWCNSHKPFTFRKPHTVSSLSHISHGRVHKDVHSQSLSELFAQLESSGDTVNWGDPTDMGGRSFAQYVQKHISVSGEQHNKHCVRYDKERHEDHSQLNDYTQIEHKDALLQFTEPIAPRFQRCSLMSASNHTEHHGRGSEESNNNNNNKWRRRRRNRRSRKEIEFFKLPVIKPSNRTMAAMATHPSNPGSRFYLFSGRAEDDVIADMFEVEVEAYTESNRQYTNLLDTITKVQTLMAELKDSYHSQRLKQSLRTIHYEQVAVYKECYYAWLASLQNALYERNDVPFCGSLRGSVSAWLRDIMQVEQITNLFVKKTVIKQNEELMLLSETEEQTPSTLSTLPLEVEASTSSESPHVTHLSSSHVDEVASENVMPHECERQVHSVTTLDEHDNDSSIQFTEREEEQEREENEESVNKEVIANDTQDTEEYADNLQNETWKYRYYWEPPTVDERRLTTPTQHLLSGAEKLKVVLHGFAHGTFATEKSQPTYMESDNIREKYGNTKSVLDKKNSSIMKLITGE